MSLTSSLYAGTSGLGNTGNALQVTSNNISNINTLGFKKGTATFADTLYQTIGTNAGASQVGLGMNVDNVAQVFTDGSLETTSNATDLAIGGDGFFIVSEAGSEERYYTRAGNFSFDENGALVTSAGYILQGWYVEGNTGEAYGAITDLILTEFTSPPDDTEEITVITNLDSDAESKSVVLSNLFKYDEDNGTTMNSDGYEYQTVVTAYDSLGSAHEVTIYYDKKSDTDWEYVITCDPSEDNRALVTGTDAAGLLARGSINFSESSGEVVSITMEELTGVIGNVGISGNNTIDDVHFEIEDMEAIQWDGYGIRMIYDGDNWELVNDSEYPLPDMYSNAEIIYSDASNVYLVLDPTSSGLDEEADLKISLDEYAMAGDTLTFDVNNPTELHVQDIENAVYDGDAYNNTTITINDPGVMTTDAQDISLVWNPYTETWAWSNPAGANDDGTLVSDADGIATYTVTNADTMDMVAEDVSLYWDGAEWKWNEELKDRDITIDTATTDLEGGVTPDFTVQELSSAGAGILAGDYTLTWDSVAGDWVAVGPGATINCTVTNTTDEGCELIIEDTVSGDSSTIEISLDDAMDTTVNGQIIAFTIESTPPEEYADAIILSGPAPIAVSDVNTIFISFDGDDTEDLEIAGVDGAADATFSFDVIPDTPPSEYSNATLSGDATYCSIDLDGSGNEDDRQDIVFTFEEDLKSGRDTDPLDDSSVITFDISGSTAWRTVTTDEAKDTGYYQFTVDFLGGEFGVTETDISFNIGSKFDGNNWVNDSLSSTQYATSSSTIYQDADGYPAGDLTGIGVESDGLVSGTYSNGQELALFMVALADFNNVNGLKNEGGNLYSATRDSGSATTNKPGQNGLGSLSSYALEMSNVDISEEFVAMIELQNAYDANAKIITTVDEMMSTVIGMKR
ncbi:flagellar hook-basal body complex protein [Desulfobacter curvatus]|uniref:flagellar hook-basal body complex protein n=1 Tax=Desulfobacter curvatus TaxID=2290 RepID=UPI00037C8A21|nr:flagellar hook-basal body complex protein [Desulfobacter curvatus]